MKMVVLLVIFFISIALNGIGRSISLIESLGGSLVTQIIVFLIGFTSLIYFLNLLFTRDNDAEIAIEFNDKEIKIGTERIGVNEIKSFEMIIDIKDSYGDRNELTGGSNYIQLFTENESYNYEFLIKSKTEEGLAIQTRDRIKEEISEYSTQQQAI